MYVVDPLLEARKNTGLSKIPRFDFTNEVASSTRGYGTTARKVEVHGEFTSRTLALLMSAKGMARKRSLAVLRTQNGYYFTLHNHGKVAVVLSSVKELV